MEEVQRALSKFAKVVIKESRTALTKKRKNASKDLYNSVKYELDVNRNSFSLAFYMSDYAKFVDRGVKGKKSTAKAPNSPYRFGSGRGKKGGLTDGIEKWIKQKGIKGRNKQGQFITHKSLSFLIARSIFNKGIKPSLFFTKPFEAAFKRLPDDLVQKFGLDVEELLQHSLKDFK